MEIKRLTMYSKVNILTKQGTNLAMMRAFLVGTSKSSILSRASKSFFIIITGECGGGAVHIVQVAAVVCEIVLESYRLFLYD
jgi:hypothetical protein